MSNYQIDAIDRKILSYLVNNARMPFLEIARECGISGAAIHQRVRKMENNGVITGSRMVVKPGALGLNVCAFISVNLSEDNKYPDVVAALKHIPEIVECHFVTGKAALFLKVYCFDNEHLMSILLNTIQRIPYIQSTDTMISSPSRLVVIRTVPPSLRTETPCFTAFSASICTLITGRSKSDSRMSYSTFRRSPKRIFSNRK